MGENASAAATGAVSDQAAHQAPDDKPGGTPGGSVPRAGAAPLFSERLYLPWYHWFLPLVAAVLLAAEVHMGYPGVRAWLPYVITVPVTLLLCWRFGAAKVEVRDGELYAGEAHLPVKFIDEIRIVPPEAKRKVLGPGFDPAAFALQRSWVKPMIFLKLADPDDPTPYWLVSTRAPDRLIDALTSEINRVADAEPRTEPDVEPAAPADRPDDPEPEQRPAE